MLNTMHFGCHFVALSALLLWGCNTTTKTSTPAQESTNTKASSSIQSTTPDKTPESEPAPTKASQCKDVENRMLAIREKNPLHHPRLEEFCSNYMTAIEISCVLDATSDAKVRSCFAQDFRSGMVVICNAPDQVELSGDPAEDAVVISNYIAMNLRNRDLAEFFSAIGGVDPPMTAELLYEKAKIAKLPSCANAKRYQDMVPD